MRSDEKIKKDIVEQMTWDGRIDASGVSVQVEDGKVILEGSVPWPEGKRAASDDAWQVEGVWSVDNRMEIEFPASFQPPTDEEVRKGVERSLSLSLALENQVVDVRVSRGLVTLEGTVDAYWKKVHARNKALEVPGVDRVKNKLAVVPSEDLTDEIIAQQIMDAIDRNRNVSASAVTVTVSEGEVSLTGTVPSREARTAAHNSALYTSGVMEVEDRLVVSQSI